MSLRLSLPGLQLWSHVGGLSQCRASRRGSWFRAYAASLKYSCRGPCGVSTGENNLGVQPQAPAPLPGAAAGGAARGAGREALAWVTRAPRRRGVGPPSRQGADGARGAPVSRGARRSRACSARRGGRFPAAVLPACGGSPRASCCEAMGASVTRAIRNFNLENRAEREISKMKRAPAPRHPSTQSLLREQVNGKWSAGARARGRLGSSAPGSRGGPSGSRPPSAGRCSHEARDIEPGPLGPAMEAAAPEMTPCDPADPALAGALSLTDTDPLDPETQDQKEPRAAGVFPRCFYRPADAEPDPAF